MRISKGWGILPAEDAEITALVYIEVFDRYGIPASAYGELYNRANDRRIRIMADGKPAPDITPELMVSGWVGNNGLANEIREREEAAQLRLSANAASICGNCYGTGLRYVRDEQGQTLGVSGRCDHS